LELDVYVDIRADPDLDVLPVESLEAAEGGMNRVGTRNQVGG
jgi:hypothetical protein